jgi:hypothetical protein
MAHLFEPWIGSQYEAHGFRGQRILILGEAHYGNPDEETSTFTRDWVENFASGARANRFFTVVSKLLLAVPAGVSFKAAERRELWDRLAFYNYIQCFPAAKARVRPTVQMWREAAKCLPPVLAQLRPGLLLILGRGLAEHLPELPGCLNRCAVPHPASFGFKLGEWTRLVQQALAIQTPQITRPVTPLRV